MEERELRGGQPGSGGGGVREREIVDGRAWMRELPELGAGERMSVLVVSKSLVEQLERKGSFRRDEGASRERPKRGTLAKTSKKPSMRTPSY